MGERVQKDAGVAGSVRKARLAEALKANLKRRKAQQRERHLDPAGEPAGEDGTAKGGRRRPAAQPSGDGS